MPTETLTDWGQEPTALVEPIVVPPVPKVPSVRLPEVPVIIENIVEIAVPLAPKPELLPRPTERGPVSPQVAHEPGNNQSGSAPGRVQQTEDTDTPKAEEIAPIADTRPPVRSVEAPKPALIKHKVLLLADEDLSPSDLLFLERILKAVNLDIDGVDLLNVYGVSDVDFAAVLRHKHINHFITFGVPFQRINLDIMMDRYHPIRFDGITFLMADSLPVIEANQALKKLLWNSLKRVFEL